MVVRMTSTPGFTTPVSRSPGSVSSREAYGWIDVIGLAGGIALAIGGGMLRGEDDIVGEPVPVEEQHQTISLDQQMDGMLGGRNGLEDDARLDELLSLQVARFDEICGLSEAQRAKCAAAADLEAREAVLATLALRRKYAGKVIDFQNREGQELWQQFHQDFSAVRAMTPRPGRPRSLVGRVMEGVLDGEQRSAWREETERRKRRDWRICIDRGLEPLESSIGVTARQHEELLAILLEQPLAIDIGKLRETFGDGNPQVGLYALSRVPEERLEAIFDERQRELIKPFVQQGEHVSQLFTSRKIVEE